MDKDQQCFQCLDLFFFFYVSKICIIISSTGRELIAVKAEKDLYYVLLINKVMLLCQIM